MTLTLFPAIDLLDGKVVRLERGDRQKVTVYADDPEAMAHELVAEGATVLHVVDLDAAFDGVSARQSDAIRRIVAAAKGLPVQLGGGLRDLDTIGRALEEGVTRVLIGTAAVERRDVLREALARFGAERIAVAVDEKDGEVKVRGWVEGPGATPAAAFAKGLAEEGVRFFLHSAISRDGTLAGPDLDALRKVGEAVAPLGGQVVCAGGVGTLEHLSALREAAISGVIGAVAGRALYENRFTIREARRVLEAK